ncbi:MAG: permease [Clostridia bacterium]|nr:permease [Clostridia bacterium]
MGDIIQREAIYLWYYISVLFKQIAPYWATGILLGSVISVFGKNRIHSLFTTLKHKKLGILGILPASLIGIASPLCMYGTIPIVASFYQQGMRSDWLAAFMMSSILLNPQLIAYSMVLGVNVVLIRFFTCLICGILAGLLIHVIDRKNSFFKFENYVQKTDRDTNPNIILRLLLNIWRNIKASGLYFIIGIVLTACFQRYVPYSAFASLFGEQKGFGVLMAATLGVPVYMCGGGTIPLLREWLYAGMSLGAASAFMITGPATKLTNLGALKSVMNIKSFAIYIAFVCLFAFITGILVNLAV